MKASEKPASSPHSLLPLLHFLARFWLLPQLDGFMVSAHLNGPW